MSFKRWTNLRVSKVEEAGTLWVRELPSRVSSDELMHFLELEKQLNNHFTNKQLEGTQHFSLLRVGSSVAVCHQEFWTRGRVEGMPVAKSEEVQVFLLDYGFTVKEKLTNIVPLTSGEWTSVPYQAKKICLAGVVPVSLQYSFTQEEMRLILKKSKHWDPAATRFVKSVFKKLPKTEFQPVTLKQDGCYCGNLTVTLPEKSWFALAPKLSPSTQTEPSQDDMTLDLAHVLMDQGYAEALTEGEQTYTEKEYVKECTETQGGGSVLQQLECYKPDTKRKSGGCADSNLSGTRCMVSAAEELDTTLSSEESVTSSLVEWQPSRHITMPSRRPSPSLCSERLENVSGNTYMSRCNNIKPSKAVSIQQVKPDRVQMEALSVSSSSLYSEEIIPQKLQHGVTRKFLEDNSMEDVCPAPWKSQKYSAHGSNSPFWSTRSKSANESDPKENYNNVSSTSARLTSSLPDSFMHDQIGNCAPTKSQQHPLCSSPCFVMNISATQDKVQKKMAAPNYEYVAHHNGFFRDAFIVDHMFGEEDLAKLVSSKENEDLVLPSRLSHKSYSGSSDIFMDHQLRSLEFMKDFENYKYTKLKPVKDMMSLQGHYTLGPFDNREKSIIKNQGNRSEQYAVHEENLLGMTRTWKGFMNNEEVYESFSTPIMSDDKGIGMNLCSPVLDEGLYSNLVLQHADTGAPNIAKLYRVFVAGEHCVSDEEVMTNKHMMCATLNSCIADVLLKKGMKPTRLQAYTWPVIAKGSSVVIVGEKSCGKTMGYVVPLLSNIFDSWKLLEERLPPGIGPVMVVVCSTWRSAKCSADYVVSLLPASVPFKIMTAWGGCGGEEEVSTGKQLLSGCDILLTTAPCLLRLLMGSQQGAATTLKRCCHLVFDDVEIILQNFSLEIKQILTTWGEERRKCGRPDVELQAVLVSSRWTELLGQLTETLLPLLEPTIVISAPCEAAIATKVASHIHFVSSENEALTQVMKLITTYVNKKKMVFVSNDNLAELLESLMNNAGMLCVTVDSTTKMWKVLQFVREWHVVQGMTMIVSHGAEASILPHDLANAEVLFHTHLGSCLTTFTHRYSFMSTNFVTDLTKKSTNCESHVILSKYTLEKLPGVLEELYRICAPVPKDVKASVALAQNGRSSKYTALCYYLKAYGKCCNRPVCSFRHEVQMLDIPQYIPRSGEITFKVIKTLNASRYLVHLIQYRKEAGSRCIDLSSSYPTLHTALQDHFTDAAHCKSLRSAEPGMLCAIEDKGSWTRAQIISVNYKETTTLISAFLIDEGKQVTVSLDSAKILPSYLAAVPQMVVEVLLCHVQPMDHDHEWTLQASSFVNNIFANRKDRRFIGRIVLALGSTMWLNPVAEFIKVEKTFVQKKALREKLLSEKFGVDNPTHIKNLEQLCAKAGVPLEPEAIHDQVWRKILTEALEGVQGGRVKEDPCYNTAKDPGADSEGYSSEESKNLQEQNNNVSSSIFQGEQALLTEQQEDCKGYSVSCDGQALPKGELPLCHRVMVEVAEVVSPKEFFIIKVDKVNELNSLEAEINCFAKHLSSCDDQGEDGESCCCLRPMLSTTAPYIARLTNDKCYTGMIRTSRKGGTPTVFFVDHDETIQVSTCQVHGCPDNLAEATSRQAILCKLAYLTIPDHLMPAATKAMLHLVDASDCWTVKAVDVEEGTYGPVYCVELTNDSCDPPKEMWKELISLRVAVLEDEEREAPAFKKQAIGTEWEKQEETLSSIFNNITASIAQDQECQPIPPLPKQVGGSECTHSTGESLRNEYQNRSKSMESKDTVFSEDCCTVSKCHQCHSAEKKEEQSNMMMDIEGKYQGYNKTQESTAKEQEVDVSPSRPMRGSCSGLALETSWSQSEDAVQVTICLTGVEQYKCYLLSSQLVFIASKGGKLHVVNEDLAGEVNADLSYVTVQRNSFCIILKKAVRGEWRSLFKYPGTVEPSPAKN